MPLEQIFYRFCKENGYYYKFKRITELKFNGLNYLPKKYVLLWDKRNYQRQY